MPTTYRPDPRDLRDATRDALFAHFESAPGDFAAYGVAADRLDELGVPELAHAFRWMWVRERFPLKRLHYSSADARVGRRVPAVYQWAWYRTRRPDEMKVHDVWPRVPRRPHSLPRVLLEADHHYFSTHEFAVQHLAGALDQLKNVYAIFPEGRNPS